MKKLFLLFAFLLTVSVTYGQDIADVSETAQYFLVRDAKNNQLSYKQKNNEELCGFSSTIIVLKSAMYFVVYDQEFKQISYKQRNSEDKVKGVAGNTIVIKSGQYTITYDKDFKQISSRQD